MQTNTGYTIIAMVEAKPGKEDALKEILSSLVKPTLAEEGCISFIFHQCSDNPAKFMFYETWKDKAAHAKHSEAKHIQAFKAIKDDFLLKPYEATIWERL